MVWRCPEGRKGFIKWTITEKELNEKYPPLSLSIIIITPYLLFPFMISPFVDFLISSLPFTLHYVIHWTHPQLSSLSKNCWHSQTHILTLKGTMLTSACYQTLHITLLFCWEYLESFLTTQGLVSQLRRRETEKTLWAIIHFNECLRIL